MDVRLLYSCDRVPLLVSASLTLHSPSPVQHLFLKALRTHTYTPLCFSALTFLSVFPPV